MIEFDNQRDIKGHALQHQIEIWDWDSLPNSKGKAERGVDVQSSGSTGVQ